MGWWVFPQMDAARSARIFTARLEQMADPGRELGLLAYHEHFLWHLRRPIVNFGHRRFHEGDAEMYDAAAWLAERPSRQLLVPQAMLAPCFGDQSHSRAVGVSSRGMWFLVEGPPSPSCSARGSAGKAISYTPVGGL